MRNFFLKIRDLFTRIKRPTLRYGLIYGLILGVVEILFSLLISYVDLGSLSSSIAWALFLIVGFLAGQKAAQQTGRISTGTIAGLLAGLIGATINELAYFIFVVIYLPDFLNLAKSSAPAGTNLSTYTPAFVLGNIAILLIFEIILNAIIAVLGGALGGMLGRKKALATQESVVYQETQFEVVVEEPVDNTLSDQEGESEPANSAE